ncbi:MAG TPA: ABC transporter permease subunit [Treponema sp.]|jgi:putative aldouronate transport system permease protein|nr:ABC transporter permease subunit [Treponema sp.]HPC71656.1 ABC transporter permease subunit [Treponema sp.]HRS04123.1 ABC transporter permease subunit [Treponema sp.]HRU28634.1 ABC transporter permease subunit [Treponema sp.]
MNQNGVKIQEKTFLQKLKLQRQLFYMSAPLILYVILFAYIPLWGWTMAFQNFKPARNFFQQEWVGIKWFLFLFKDDNFLKVLRNTIAMSLINLSFGYIGAIALALILNEVKERFFKRTIQTISYLPHFLSWVIVSGLVASMLSVEDGAINQLLLSLRLIKEPIMWLGEPKYFWWITGFTYLWKEIGWNSIIYLAAISGIDPTLYEVAEIDGCGRLKKMWYITLPGIKSTIMVLLIMSIGHILDAGFELQFLLRNGLIQDYADTIDIYVLTFGLNSGNYSLATAAGMFKNIVNIALIFLANFLAKRMGEERLI